MIFQRFRKHDNVVKVKPVRNAILQSKFSSRILVGKSLASFKSKDHADETVYPMVGSESRSITVLIVYLDYLDFPVDEIRVQCCKQFNVSQGVN